MQYVHLRMNKKIILTSHLKIFRKIDFTKFLWTIDQSKIP